MSKTDMLSPPDLRILGPRLTVAGDASYSLKGLGTGKLPDGSLVYVQSLRAYFQLSRTSTQTPDDISIVRAALGAGNWHRRASDFSGPSPWLQQTDWYIDAVSGSDENDGATAATALATHAEFERRMGSCPLITQAIKVTLLTSINEAISLRYKLSGAGSYVHWVGTPQAVLASGTVTAAAAVAFGVEGTITDGAGDFTGLKGQRIRITGTGESNDPKSFLGKLKAGVTQARCGSPVYFSTPWSSPSAYAPTGQTYAVEEQPTALGFNLHIDRLDCGPAGSPAAEVGALIEDVDFSATATPLLTTKAQASGSTVVLFGCRLGQAQIYGPGGMRFVGCTTRDSAGDATNAEVYDLESRLDYHSGGGWSFLRGSRTTIWSKNQFDEKTVKMEDSSWMLVYEAGIYDAPEVFFGALSVIQGNTFCTVIFLWGSGNLGKGVLSNSVFQYGNGLLPTITGSTPGVDDINVGGTDMAWAALPFIDPVNQSQAVPGP